MARVFRWGQISPSQWGQMGLTFPVRHHVEDEERDMFPRMRKTVGRNRVVEIGDAMGKLRRKARTASPKAARKAAKKTLQRVA
jgi:hypothetical protein